MARLKVTVVVRLSQAAVKGRVSGKRKPGTAEPLAAGLGSKETKSVLREGVWSDGEGPGLLAGILWFLSWHLFSSVLWGLLTLPALTSLPAEKGEQKKKVILAGGHMVLA